MIHHVRMVTKIINNHLAWNLWNLNLCNIYERIFCQGLAKYNLFSFRKWSLSMARGKASKDQLDQSFLSPPVPMHGGLICIAFCLSGRL